MEQLRKWGSKSSDKEPQQLRIIVESERVAHGVPDADPEDQSVANLRDAKHGAVSPHVTEGLDDEEIPCQLMNPDIKRVPAESRVGTAPLRTSPLIDSTAREAKPISLNSMRFYNSERERLEAVGFRPLRKGKALMPNLVLGLVWAGSVSAFAFAVSRCVQLGQKIDANQDVFDFQSQLLLNGTTCRAEELNSEQTSCVYDYSGCTPEFIEACSSLIRRACYLGRNFDGAIVGSILSGIATALSSAFLGSINDYSLTLADRLTLKDLRLAPELGESSGDYARRLVATASGEGFAERYRGVSRRIARGIPVLQLFTHEFDKMDNKRGVEAGRLGMGLTKSPMFDPNLARPLLGLGGVIPQFEEPLEPTQAAPQL